MKNLGDPKTAPLLGGKAGRSTATPRGAAPATGFLLLKELFRTRLLLLAASIVLVAGTTLWGVQAAWSRINELERRVTTTQLESFRLAQDFAGRLRDLNNSILLYAARREPATWNEFEQAATNLDRWIDQYDPRVNPKSILTTDPERRLFQQLNSGYDEYLRAARTLHSNQRGATMSAEAYNAVKEFQDQAQQLLDVNDELAKAHREAEQAFLAEVNDSLDNLRAFLLAAVVLTLGLVGLLGLMIYRDMIAPLRTKLVQSEALLERQEKLATLGTLAAGIAHEIRNPLTSMKARLYTLGKHIKGNEGGTADAAIIGSEVSRLERIVQEVLQFARPSEPRLAVVRADVPLREVQALVASSLEKENVQVNFEGGPELWISIDAPLIKQVVINLVRNSTEAMENGGTVTLRVRRARATFNGQPHDVAVLEVADTGKGIPADIEKRLFDPFFTTKESGTGLGLSIAARIVEKHGGALQYQTIVGRGTTFGIVLPLAHTYGEDMGPDSASSQ
ncbi:MAG TPA: ATP-binding protein [Verrucomicrobiae bacterium]|nr:ATP-binding protein [Verrucomicrobiae bacterium]